METLTLNTPWLLESTWQGARYLGQGKPTSVLLGQSGTFLEGPELGVGVELTCL